MRKILYLLQARYLYFDTEGNCISSFSDFDKHTAADALVHLLRKFDLKSAEALNEVIF